MRFWWFSSNAENKSESSSCYWYGIQQEFLSQQELAAKAQKITIKKI